MLGVALLLPEWNLVVTFAGLFAVIIGFALLTPAVTLVLMRGVERPARRAGVIVRMAPRTVTRALSRTSVAVAAAHGCGQRHHRRGHHDRQLP
ncbi:MAG: hypothetical protein R2851_19935 [Caldilineaceae bacterium]